MAVHKCKHAFPVYLKLKYKPKKEKAKPIAEETT
jgi:hypothetical protein